MVKVQVRIGDQDTPQFSRLATLAGVTPPITEADLQTAEQQQRQSQSRKEVRAQSRRDSLLHKENQSKLSNKTRLFQNDFCLWVWVKKSVYLIHTLCTDDFSEH